MANAALTIKDSGPTLIIIGEVVSIGQQLGSLLDDIECSSSQFNTQYEARYA
jgi:uroporphyrin-III C-methyltransferase